MNLTKRQRELIPEKRSAVVYHVPRRMAAQRAGKTNGKDIMGFTNMRNLTTENPSRGAEVRTR